MKIPQPSKICDFAFRRKSAQSASPLVINSPGAAAPASCNRKSAIVNRKSQDGIALVITLIMLAITLVMAVAFLALARRERSTVSTITDTTIARHAADSAMAHATAQVVANMLGGFTNGFGSNTLNQSLLVSTNYINPAGFLPGISNPTNVNYTYLDGSGNPMSTAGVADWEQNISNLWFLPRAPVFYPSNSPITGYDFRYYLDLNQNGKYDTNYFGQDIDNETPPKSFGLPYLHTGDPEWIGVLEHPDAPHGPNNHFIARYAFIAVPVGNTLDINYIYNQSRKNTLPVAGQDFFMRNQGVGSWEINLAAFLADLNTNIWGQSVASSFITSANGTPPGLASQYYLYREPADNGNSGYAFSDASSLLAWRYNYNRLAAALSLFSPTRAPLYFQFQNTFDAYSDGQLQTSLNTNANSLTPDDPTKPWSGADSPNHYFAISDFFDTSKLPPVPSFANSFVGRLSGAGTSNDTYNAYTYYRMLGQLGTDSAADDGRLNLNYSNAVVSYVNNNGILIPSGVNVIPGAETNLVLWRPQEFFIAAADRMLRTYTTNWFQSNPSNFMVNYYGYIPRGHIDATGVGVTNFPYFGITNQIPWFGITNIPVLVNGSFVYNPSVNRLLQLAANIYDASTNNNFNLPHVFRPIFENDGFSNVFIVGFTNVTSVPGGVNDPQLAAPHLISDLALFNPSYTPIYDANGLVNVYGVPWIIGAKKGLPNFNQFYMLTSAQVSRKIEITRNTLNPKTATYHTNQMYVMGISNNVGVSFWNSYSNSYPRTVTIHVSDYMAMAMTNVSPLHGIMYWTPTIYTLVTNVTINPAVSPWFGSQWSGTPSTATPSPKSFWSPSWNFVYQSQLPYDYTSGLFDFLNPFSPITAVGQQQLPQFGLLVTNYLQVFILDGQNVIDYVQLRDPVTVNGLNQALADPDYPQPAPNNGYLQWSTNASSNARIPYGVINQLYISGQPPTSAGGPTPANLMPPGGQWSTAPTPMGSTTPEAEAVFFKGFFTPTFSYGGQIYINSQTSIQAPYTPSRMIYSAYLMQANDPLVHYTSSDLNAQVGTWAVWNGGMTAQNGFWYHSDDPSLQPTPQVPGTPIGGRYQPWARKGQMGFLNALTTTPVLTNYACIDPLAYASDYWDFPTNQYPTVGWIGRVHRGTPWQTIYLKDSDLTRAVTVAGANTNFVGASTWANWTGNIQTDFGQYYDALNSAPVQDRLLFDIFTTRLNDNAARGTLPVNAGAGQPEGGIAAWSALFSGMVVLTNTQPVAIATTPLSYGYHIIDPAGQNWSNSPLWQIVNNPTNGINATRANTTFFPYQSFAHAGDILATPRLSGQSPYLNLGTGKNLSQQGTYGINDEMYEWLPQQMMGLVRRGESRYVLYCFGQTLHPAPNGTVLGGSYFQLVTNYQVAAESAIRAVIRVDNANTPTPHAVVESYNVLPPN